MYHRRPLEPQPRSARLTNRDDADWFIEQVRGDEPEIAAKLRIEEHELEAGGLN